MSKHKEPQATPQKTQPMVKVAQGLSMVDPLTGTTYTSHPMVATPSSWVSAHLALGNLIEV